MTHSDLVATPSRLAQAAAGQPVGRGTLLPAEREELTIGVELPGDVRASLHVDSVRTAGRARLTLQLEWYRQDPLAVRLRLLSEPDHPAMPTGQWVLLRDFLRYGLEEPTGDGDVRIGPGPLDRVVLRLARATGGTVVVPVATKEVRAFLDDTERIVASGAEGADDAVDALIEALLRAGP